MLIEAQEYINNNNCYHLSIWMDSPYVCRRWPSRMVLAGCKSYWRTGRKKLV